MKKRMVILLVSVLIISLICQSSSIFANSLTTISLRETTMVNNNDLVTTSISSNIYADYDEISSWARKDVLQAYERGLMQGTIIGDKRVFVPKGYVTFGEAFAMVLNLVNNKNLDIKECMEKLNYYPVNLWVFSDEWSNRTSGKASFYYNYLAKKYGFDNLSQYAINKNSTSYVIYYYSKYSYDKNHNNTITGNIQYWPSKNYKQTLGNYPNLSIQEQFKYLLDLDIERMNVINNPEFKLMMKKYAFFMHYREGVELVKLSPTSYDSKYIFPDFNERHERQLIINEKLYPNLNDKNHWAYQQYSELMKYMYLNGIIDEEYISLNTPIRKDQFAALMYWILAASGQTFDWSGHSQYAVGKILEIMRPGFKEFANLPKDAAYAYAGPLNQLKELDIMVGEGSDVIQYDINIPREQIALIMNKIYDYASDHKLMNRYIDYMFDNTPKYPWYRAYIVFDYIDKNDFPGVLGESIIHYSYTPIHFYILYELQQNWIDKN